jgi:hypothetical protein
VRDTSRAAIAHAAGASGVDFTYLLAQARLESGLDPKAQASTSSARGLYQFTNATWAQTLQKHGNMLGLSGAALADPSARAQLMALRDDPHASAMMAAGLAGDNMQALTNVLGRQPDASELYLAHFLGADGAGRFLTAMAADPTQSAAALLPRAAASNQSIFYDASGQSRSLQQVMDLLRGRMASAMRDEGGVDPSSYITTANYAPVNATVPLPDPATMGGPIARQFAAATVILPVLLPGGPHPPACPWPIRSRACSAAGPMVPPRPMRCARPMAVSSRWGCDGTPVLHPQPAGHRSARRHPDHHRADGDAHSRLHAGRVLSSSTSPCRWRC